VTPSATPPRVPSPFLVFRHPPDHPLDPDVCKLLARVFVDEGFANAENVGEAFDPAVLASRGVAWIARAAHSAPALGVVLLVEPGNRFRQVATEGELEVHLLAVDPAHRRTGVATALLRECVADANRRRARALVLSTQPTMRSAHALYEKLGFIRNAARDWTRGDQAYRVFELAIACENDARN